MKLNVEPLKSWFGYSRRERRSSSILAVIIIIIMAVRFMVPEKKIAIVDITGNSASFTNPSLLSGVDLNSTGQPFNFDPNAVSYDSLIMLGLTPKEASTLISYRTKGGKFRNPSDIKKVYGIDEAKAMTLIRFVNVRKDNELSVEKTKVSYGRQKPMVEINSCDSASLVSLPGIGPVLSVRIIKYRRLLGGFAKIDQLKEVYGLPPETFDLIKGRVYADSLAIKKIDINTAGNKELSGLPYFERYEVTAILKYRELNVRINGIKELIDNNLISKEKAEKVRCYLSFR